MTTSPLMTTPTLVPLVERAMKGRGQEGEIARQAIALIYGPLVREHLRPWVRDPNVADDVTHEWLLLLLARELPPWDPEQERFRDFVRRTVDQICQRYRRQSRPVTSHGRRRIFERRELTPERRRLAVEQLQSLPALSEQTLTKGENDVFRVILELGELDYTEVSRRLGISQTAARQRLSRARSKLYQVLSGAAAEAAGSKAGKQRKGRPARMPGKVRSRRL